MYAFRSNTVLVQVFQSTETLVLFGIPAESGRNVPPSPPLGNYFPSGRHGHRFRSTKSSCGIVISLFEASVQKARKGLS